ncbi:MAG: hypothetical protein KatS3mg110_2218 [Pirellulaceae bacterium]|nr:MAG: hypothetical protein KatS3mg110_2218 [Pirellulaceae bacterium]
MTVIASNRSSGSRETAALLAERSIRRAGEVMRFVRAVRLAGSLVGLPPKHRTALVQAVSTLCRTLVSSGYELHARLLVGHQEQQCYVLVLVQVRSGPDADQHKSPIPILQATLSRWASRLDLCLLDETYAGGPLVKFGQALGSAVELPAGTELSYWSRLVAAKSLEEALRLAVGQYRSLSAELTQIKDLVERRGELAGLPADENLALLSLVASKSRNLITILEPNGGILWVNQAFEEATGYQLAQARGRRLDELLFGPSTDPAAVQAFQHALKSGSELLQELMVYRRDGRTFWVECNLIPVRSKAGDITCWLSVDVDITKWRQTEEALREAKRLAEESARLKSDFLANISHEIRTPMNAIIGMTELALATALSREQREYLLTVQSAADSLLQLLNDVLDFSKIEAGKMTIDEVDFNLADAVRDTLRALSVKAREKQLTLVARIPLDLPVDVRGDPIRLKQILFNLIGNAIKFTEQGEVAVEVELLWRTRNELGYHIIVRDTGIGIPEDKLGRIFDAFSQADSSTTRRYGGTGLGLTITANLVRLMKGRIWVESTVGVGSAFHVNLRLAAGESCPKCEEWSSALRGKKLLLVHHHLGERRFLEQNLNRMGLEVVSAGDGAEAAQAVAEAVGRQMPFDIALVVSDRPSVDGFPIVTALRESVPQGVRHVALLVSSERPDDQAASRQLGVAVLMRPVSLGAIAEFLTEILHPDRPQTARADARYASELPHSLSDKAWRPLRVLVVDDHDANRKLATTILQRRGHHCVEATSGEEAIRLWEQQPFDVILMDVRMPQMDGFQATQIIRRREQAGAKHVPIIALTAHAMKGDRERCLAEGMDGYLAKPLRPADLVRMVESLGGRELHMAPEVSPAISQPSADPGPREFDFQKALESMDNDQSLLLQQMQYFLKDGPELVSRIRRAIARKDGRDLELAAHRLKSLTARYEARMASTLAAELEERGTHGRWEGAEQQAEQLEQLVSRLCRAVQQYVAAQSH